MPPHMMPMGPSMLPPGMGIPKPSMPNNGLFPSNIFFYPLYNRGIY